MDEIKALREQIINYQKTRQVYVEYRKSGYSEKFYEQHRADITLHKAAKKYFDEQGVQKLPSLKELNEEYNRLLTEQRASSPEYRKLRDEWKELVTARSNLKHYLNITEKGKNEKVKKRNEPER